MRPLFESIAHYFRGEAVPPSFTELEAEIGRDDLRVICIEVLSWLRRQATYKNTRGLELPAGALWSEKLVRLVENEPLFRDSLIVEQGVLKFGPGIVEEERAQLREWGRQIYNPPMMK